ncbi:MAG: hypothetical protein LBM78_03910, partial [Clostridiales bacterium]|nr:hypothetical protein [Clostridiales bacterium]
MDDFNNLKADIEAKRTAAAAPPPVPEEKRAAAPAATQSNAKVDSFAGETKVVQDTVHEKCPACGAPMTYDATAKMLFCEHCGSTKQIENAAPAAEQALDLSLDGAPKWAGETRVFRCENCGGESIFENNTFAKDCPFCGSPSVTTVEDMAGIRPNAVLPFAVSKEQAADLYALWAKKRTFAPKAFR